MAFNQTCDLENNTAFKKIFGTEKHQDILMHFLNAALGNKGKQAIKTVQFLETDQTSASPYKKDPTVAVLCEDEKSRQYIVETQIIRTKYSGQKAQHSTVKATIKQMKAKGLYDYLKPIFIIVITDFVLFPHELSYKFDHTMWDKETDKLFSFTFIELPKFKKTREAMRLLSNGLEKWCYCFKYAVEIMKQDSQTLMGDNPMIKATYSALDKAHWTTRELIAYEREWIH